MYTKKRKADGHMWILEEHHFKLDIFVSTSNMKAVYY